MFVHMAQVHKQVCTKIPNAIVGRDMARDVEVYGMDGIPIEDLLKHHEGDTRTLNLIKHDILTTNLKVAEANDTIANLASSTASSSASTPFVSSMASFKFQKNPSSSGSCLLMPSSNLPTNSYLSPSNLSIHSANPIFSALLQSSHTPTLSSIDALLAYSDRKSFHHPSPSALLSDKGTTATPAATTSTPLKSMPYLYASPPHSAPDIPTPVLSTIIPKTSATNTTTTLYYANNELSTVSIYRCHAYSLHSIF
jgi:hypothetical protein